MRTSTNRQSRSKSNQKIAGAPPRAEVDRILGWLRAGDKAQARTGAKKLVMGFPKSPIAQDVYGIVARGVGDFEGACGAFKRALKMNQRFLPSIVNLANTLGEMGDHVEASKLFSKAIEVEGESPRLLVAYGKSLDAAGQVDRAEKVVKRALELEPGNPEAAAVMGHFATYSGNRDEAAERYADILQKNPRNSNIHRNLTNVKKYQSGDPHIAQMQTLIEDPDISRQDRVHLGFAIGKALDDIGEYNDAFTYFERGNRGYFEQKPYDPEHERKLGVLLRSSFATPQQPLNISEKANPRPIFVVAPPRSGTSMLEQILTCSDEVHDGGELGFLGQSAFEARAQVRPPDVGMFRNIRQGYLRRLADSSNGKPVVIDKQSANNLWVGHILCSMPEAQIIHLRRDPRAVGWSIYRRIFDSPLMSWAYDLPTLGKYLRDYEQLMQFWNRRFPGRIHTVNYEALTEDPEGVLRPLITGLGLEWNETFLSFHSAGRTVRTASALQVRQPIYKGSSEQWRAYETHLKPMIEALELPWD